jgi:beta-galactosidase
MRWGFLVMDEAFDCWQKQKNPNDFHLIFDGWSEADVRAMMRRDRNHPSIFAWSIGNEVGEQTDGANGERISRQLSAIVHEEDPFRGSTASMNVAKPNQPFPKALDMMSLNYQGEDIRDSGAYAGFQGTRTPPLYQARWRPDLKTARLLPHWNWPARKGEVNPRARLLRRQRGRALPERQDSG